MSENVWHTLDELIDRAWTFGCEIAVRLDVVSEAAWSGELRFTEKPNAVVPDFSLVWYAAGGSAPDEVMARLLAEASPKIKAILEGKL